MPNHPDAASFSLPGDITVQAPNNLGLMTPFVLSEQGDWFESEIRFVRRWLRPGMAVVDIGANYGVYTLTAAKLVGPEGRVWAYEPGSLPRSFLADSLETNHFTNVELVGCAMSDYTGEARLGIASNAELNSLNETGESGETVPLTTLDAESARWQRDIDFVKLDAEGEEIRILSQAKEFFARQQPLVMFEYKHGSKINHGLLQAIGELGLKLFRHLPGLNALVPLAPTDVPDEFLLNVFGCSEKRAHELAAQGLLVESVPELPEIDVAGAPEFVEAWMKARPWRERLCPRQDGAAEHPGARIYLAALAELIRGEDPSLGLAERLAHQRRGLANLLVSLRQDCTIPRMLSMSRAAAALGERRASVDTLAELHRLLETTQEKVPHLLPEPFLPPEPRHDDLAPGDHLAADLLAIMLDEPLLERGAFSLYFQRDRAAPLLQHLAKNPARTPMIERRLTAARRIIRF